MKNKDLSNHDELRGHVLDWLRANEIDPNRIPANPCMTLVGDQLTTDEHVYSETGKIQLAPGTDEVARTTKTYTITAPPPPDVAEWLLPRCSTCGR